MSATSPRICIDCKAKGLCTEQTGCAAGTSAFRKVWKGHKDQQRKINLLNKIKELRLLCAGVATPGIGSRYLTLEEAESAVRIIKMDNDRRFSIDYDQIKVKLDNWASEVKAYYENLIKNGISVKEAIEAYQKEVDDFNKLCRLIL